MQLAEAARLHQAHHTDLHSQPASALSMPRSSQEALHAATLKSSVGLGYIGKADCSCISAAPAALQMQSLLTKRLTYT